MAPKREDALRGHIALDWFERRALSIGSSAAEADSDCAGMYSIIKETAKKLSFRVAVPEGAICQFLRYA